MDGSVEMARPRTVIKSEESKYEGANFEYKGYIITVEPPNEINSLTRVIVSTLHGTHVTEWIDDKGLEKAKEYIDAKMGA
jgi:hypothetical protein